MKSLDNDLAIILTTHDDMLQAQDLAKLLVEERAAACVNLLPDVVSIFKWDGAIQQENEILLLIKTTADRVPAVRDLLKRHHTYDVPEIVRLEGEILHKPYLDWVRDCLA